MKRQNGKARNVYIISNLGSFGENIFKVGMTRRLEPMDRVKELSDASVPFMFDVHSFIFSDDAVALEQKLHSILEKNRVNKINLRKEFFNVSIDELEKIVTEIDPTAEFNKTMIAEEYRQSQVV
ncbi:GIY-YIG nuclease family protein [Turicibacter sanguinis]|nr:GIY-YIG nuclease family protein [Turicibacter sanguinis]